ncbi:MAG: hypothetical protein IIZ92_15020 [Aquincola sp.]|nr:hypothetical protein [Aquincola sp.]|tara:strand:- start:5009 stop:5593 length:585 start_codon:yes stop_codon:yes gene_type:complete
MRADSLKGFAMNPTDVSSRLKGLAAADHLAADGEVSPNAEAEQLLALGRAIRLHEERLDLAWCGAAVARLFLARPWLQRVNMQLMFESVYNDEGRFGWEHCAIFKAAESVPGADLPAQVQNAEGSFNPDAVADLLHDAHVDEAYELCLPFLDADEQDSCTFALDREDLAAVLTARPVSGLAVARVLWPDHDALA